MENNLFTIYKRFAMILLPCVVLNTGISCNNNAKKIPVISREVSNNKNLIDSLHFTDHLNQRFLFSSIEENVHVVNFFFTSCPSICPLMEVPLNALAEKHDEVRFISFTIDPDRDSISVLKEYHDLHKKPNQTLLRGSKQDLGIIAKLYLNEIDTDNIESLYHTSNAVLLDSRMQIRGIFNVLDTQDLAFLETDLAILLKNEDPMATDR